MINQSWRILIADQSPCYLESIQLYLAAQPKLAVVDISCSLKSTLELTREHRYDLIIIGEYLIDATLIDTVQQLASQGVEARKAAFCYAYTHALLLQHNLGLVNFLISKRESLSSLVLAIHRICKDEVYVSPYLQHLIRIDKGNKVVMRDDSPLFNLSARQVNVLKLLANGFSVKEVAKELHLSPKSVDSHKYRLMLKLHIKDRVELARFAIREGLIEA